MNFITSILKSEEINIIKQETNAMIKMAMI
jgi:hypothetical protein